jgi:hypothetical protein
VFGFNFIKACEEVFQSSATIVHAGSLGLVVPSIEALLASGLAILDDQQSGITFPEYTL